MARATKQSSKGKAEAELWAEAVVAYQSGRLPEAARLCHAILKANPRHDAARHLVGLVFYGSRDYVPAVDWIKAAIAIAPANAEYHANLAAALRALGRLPEAEAACRRALTHDPALVGALNTLGNVLCDLGRASEAVAALSEAIRLKPDHAVAHANLGHQYWLLGWYLEAEEACRRALDLDPGSAQASLHLGNALIGKNDPVGAEAAFRRALELDPGHSVAHSSLLFCLNFDSELPAEAIFEEYRRWDERHARPLLPDSVHHDNDPDPERRLRVGYVSADFRYHAVNFFFEPLLAAHDHDVVEIFCYAHVANPDAVTARLRGLADHWRPIVGLDDQAVADLIRADAIDVLVDLTSHTANGRLLVFARKPAPVQISYFIGQGYTSGLSAIDAFIADEALVPPGFDHLFAERTVVRLPRPPLAYLPPEGMPEVGPLPALEKGHVTFGSFNRTLRLNERVIALWARLLHAVPDSRLMLNSKPFQERECRDRFEALFAAHGIEANRLTLVYTTPQSRTWAAYNEVDIALDPFPDNAVTTTVEALWMGVPVVSMAERPSVGRLGACILGAIGMRRWVASSSDDYLAIGMAAAANLDRLAALRAGLRPRVEASPLRDGAGLARAMEAAYRALWRGWCETVPVDQPLEVAAESPPEPAPVPAVDFGAVVAAWRAGDADEVRRLCRGILAADPEHPDALHALGLLEHRAGASAAAEALIRRAIAADAEVSDYHANLGAVLRRLRRFDEAEAACRRALELRPGSPDALNNLGNTLSDLGRLSEAEAAFRQAIERDPGRMADAWENLARLLMRTGRLFEAERLLSRACERWPRNPALYELLGVALQERGGLSDAEEVFQLALRLRPDRASTHGARLFSLNYRADLGAEEVFEEYRRWDQTQARPLRPADPGHTNGRVASRRLRVGYVSADFRFHAVSFFFEPLLAAHDAEALEIFLYADVAAPDAVSERLRGLAPHWRPIAGLSDQAVADLVRADAIDVLVDLAGHTANGRLLVFARKPAPVQVTYPLGAAYTSGLSAIDAYIADAVLAPPGYDHLFAERVARLPRCPLVYLPPAGMPEVGPLPAARAGHVTFGCFSRLIRINDGVIAAWAALLTAVPGSRLILNNQPFVEAEAREAFERRFAEHDIAADRLDLVFTAPQPRTWDAYNDIDIALDPFPHNAGTTTLEALWMGVPVLSLADRPSVGRLGASILGALGLSDWVAANAVDYVALGAAKAADLEGLAEVRAGLRARMVASPLRDAASLARLIESLYRELWRRWCRPPELDALILAFQRGDLDRAREIGAVILARQPDEGETLHVLGLAEYKAGRFERAESLIRSAIAGGQVSPEVWSNHGAALRALGRLADAEAAYREALRRAPNFADAYGNLGNVLKDQRRLDEAIEAFAAARRLRPDQPATAYNLGSALHDRGRLAEAEAAYREAIEQKPDHVNAWNNLAACLAALDRTAEAETAYRKALDINPDYFEAWNNLGTLLLRDGRLFGAERALRRAGALRPDNGSILNNLGVVLEDLGRPLEAEQAFRRALELRPDYPEGHGALLFSLNYRADLTAEQIFAEYKYWDQHHAGRFTPAVPSHANNRDPNRRLRVGYVSADFRHHAITFFFEPLLAAHDRAAVEVTCYAQVANPDAVTGRLQGMADRWRSIVGLDDQSVADMIRADGIDVLVDLTSHTANGRLLVFARKPAPVQISYFIGHGSTSGLSAMDAFLADETLVPPGYEHLFSEPVVRLPRLPLAYLPSAAMPEVGPLPALERGYVTFGSFSRTVRLNERVIAVWSRVLAAVPGSRLVLNSKPYLEDETRELFLSRFAAHGIGAERLDLIHTAPQPKTWAAYGGVDIALDTFPQNTVTTTIEALWMGVPSLSLADRPSVGRLGAAILGAVGLSDWVAADDDDYVALAVARAADLDGLAALRAGLRAQVEASPLRDGPGLAQVMEAAYRDLWRHWCEAAPPARPPELDQLIGAFRANDMATARAIGAAILARRPDEGETLHALGLVEYMAGEYQRAAERIQAALAAGYAAPEVYTNLGAVLRAAGRLAEAEVAYREAVALRPDFADAHRNLATVLNDQRHLDGAIDALTEALRLNPGAVAVWCALGATHLDKGDWVQAEMAFRKATELAADSVDGWRGLASALHGRGRLFAAHAALVHAITLKPDGAAAYAVLGAVEGDLSRLAEAERAFRTAVTLRPDDAALHGALLRCLSHRPDPSAEDVAAEYRRWDARFGLPRRPAVARHDNERDPERRLRVGYLSADFRDHGRATFTGPLLAAHDPGAVELFCYDASPAADAVTARFRARADQWRPIQGLADEVVAELIRRDRIDVLVDLAGHGEHGRPTLFAGRPAPVQVAYPIGQDATTGLSAMDALLADAILAPPGSEHLFGERTVIRLARPSLCYALPDALPAIGPTPALANGHVTFGCFGRTMRLNDQVVWWWSRLLHTVPNARLTLNSRPFAEDETRAFFQARFGRCGITADRLDLLHTEPGAETWEAHNRIDIALDPFPHTGATTTLEALCMGVPVVTVAGRPGVGRLGALILGALGLPEYVSPQPEGCAMFAAIMTSDIDRLCTLRRELRERVRASPLCDAPGLARAVEDAYRDLWRRWCSEPAFADDQGGGAGQ